MNFVAIDFETATGKRNSPCAVAIVMVKDGVIAHEWSTLIKPPDNKYGWAQTKVHGLSAKDTKDAPTFKEIFPQIKRRLEGNTVVAHNESFDRSVLKAAAELNGLDCKGLKLGKKWICTMKKFKEAGFKSAKLNECCKVYKIDLDHHEALSDARASAKLHLVEIDKKDKKDSKVKKDKK